MKIITVIILLVASLNNAYSGEGKGFNPLAKFICKYNSSPSEHCINSVNKHLVACMHKAKEHKLGTHNMNEYYKFIKKCAINKNHKK